MNKKDFIEWFNSIYPAYTPVKDVVWEQTQSGYAVALVYIDGNKEFIGTFASKGTTVLRQILKNFHDAFENAANGK